MAHLKTVILIAGPTAVGKTAMAIKVAQHLQTEIISADSRQCYREMNIGVALPSLTELATVPHHFIATHSIHQKVTAAAFEDYALQKASDIFKSKDTLVMVGGTGLYMKAFEEGLDEIPEVPDSIRNEVIMEYNEKGLDWLQDEVKRNDPEFYSAGEIQNPHRLMRALEVWRTTGHSITTFKKGNKKNRPFRIIKLALHLPKEALHHNISVRVDAMMEMGLEAEAKSLLPYRHLTALQTVGYKELFQYFDGTLSLKEAILQIKQHTRQYAKRQLTWFRKDIIFKWFEPTEQMGLINCIDEELKG